MSMGDRRKSEGIMARGDSSPFMFRMKGLDKPEYTLLKELRDRWNLDDDKEVVAVGMVALYELCHYQGGVGEQWVVAMIDRLRSVAATDRHYTLPPLLGHK